MAFNSIATSSAFVPPFRFNAVANCIRSGARNPERVERITRQERRALNQFLFL
jgi:hypothetical protein